MASRSSSSAKTRVGRYELGRTLGEGSFAKVKFAKNVETGENVAIKILDKEKVLKHKMIGQIKREISTMKLIRHPNVIRMYEVMASKTKIYIVLEFVTGGELFDKISSRGRLKEDEARKYFQQLINAVDYCHSRGVYHRDLKPENLLLDANGTLKVSDFGLSALPQQVREDGLLHTTCGTPNYVAPEVIDNKGYDGAKADLWSCGVILFVLMAGYLPFEDSNIMALYKKIFKADFTCPPWFSSSAKKLIKRILDPNPPTRITIAEVLQNEWFKKGYQSPKFEHEDVSLDDVDAIFNESGDSPNLVVERREERSAAPVTMNAFELISKSQGLNLSSLFEKQMMSSMADTAAFGAEPSPSAAPAPAPTAVSQAPQEVKSKTKKKKADKSGGSDVWDHFKKLKSEDDDLLTKAECNYCSKLYTSPSTYGTSTLRKHLTKCKKYPYNSADKKQKTLASSFAGQEEESKLVAWKFDQEKCREAFTKMVIIDEMPFKCVDRLGFRLFMSVSQPRFQFMSRITVARDCLKLYATLKKDLKKALGQATSRICLTTDTWTSLQNMSYMVLTAHFIDNNWKLHKRILNFTVIASHKGVAIGQAIESCMLQWGIEKVFTITVDNASSNDTAITHLKKKLSKKNALVLDGDFFHMRCCAHILNLIVRDGVKEVEESITRIRGAVRYIRSSPQRAQQFKICCDQEKITCKSTLCLDVPTRWNYTYLMLETALKFQKAFERLDELEPHFCTDLKDGVPSERDWDHARVLTKFLKIFYDCTKHLSGNLYVTANVYFHEVCAIEQRLCEWARHVDIQLSLMAMKMKEKFDKYWGNIDKINMMLLIAVVLDPRYKLKYVNFCYTLIYHKEKVIELEKRVKDLMNRLYIHYQMIDTSVSRQTTLSQSSNEINVDEMESEGGDQVKSLQTEFFKHLEEEDNVDSKSEVDRYLEEGVEKDSPNYEILSWWKLNSTRYPILSKVARDVLAIPVSTVASESAFSTGGRVLDPFRSSLTPKIVECLICAQDWLRASALPIEVEESIDELSEIESSITEDPELVELFSNNSVLS